MNNELMKRADLLMRQNRFAQAVDAFRAVLAKSPEHAAALASLGWCLTKCGKLEEGETHIHHALGLSPDSAYIHQIHALYLSERGRYPEAEIAIERTLSIDPTFAPYYAQHSRILRLQGKLQSAVTAAERGLAISPEEVRCIIQKMLSQIAMSDFPTAHDTVRMALQLAPENAIAHAGHGYSLLQRREYAAAATEFREALRLDPHLGWARDGLMQCLKERFPWYAKAVGFRLLTLSSYALRWYAMFAVIVLYGLVRYAIAEPPKPTYFLELPLLFFFPLVFLTFSLESLAIWLLTYDREGRHLVAPLQRQLSGAVVGLLILASCAFIAAIIAVVRPMPYDAWPVFMIAFSFAAPIPPLSKVFVCDPGWSRDSIWKVVAISGVAGLVCFKLAAATMGREFPLETNYYSCIGLVIVTMAVLGASVLLPSMKSTSEEIS
ncbi:tetratricopeptide repeat protein [Blastopirellula marina]|uniref:Uncharacterized protein n=1 Tax=Blastopirellula marina DSM 3645 TaxID=314230 RepID=A3ZM85_9BACT|nr:tetratricopeptide repeat protein [Blastopirellula marina]EAQ82054.1 hypothetical protein DSM3645_00030 [Blastopirellula marina DSM 3645]